jgi:hypothetical protein
MSDEKQKIEDILVPKNKKTWSKPDFWQGLYKKLSVSPIDYSLDDSSTDDGKMPPNLNKESARKSRLVQDGYALGEQDKNKSRFEELTTKLREGISSLHEQNIPATFILLYDETWEYARFGKETLRDAAHHSNIFNFDVLAWYIDPKENTAGFSPHRDRQPDMTSDSFHKDEQAKYVTLWTALSRASPENSCLYVIPKQYDPGYVAGDDEEDPLQRALSTKESYQHIRALPRESGQSVMFTHRILHWGSRGNPETSTEPRVAISFVCSDPSFERPYVNPNYFEGDRIPPFRIRLLLVCAQLLIYYQRFDLPKACLRACYEYCKEHEDELDPTYRGKVGIEFVKAMKEANATTVGDDGTKNGSTDFASVEDDDDDEEAILEEMLEADHNGYGEFEDDFDELEGTDGGGDNFDDDDDDFSEEEDAAEGSLFGKRKASDDAKLPRKKAKS